MDRDIRGGMKRMLPVLGMALAAIVLTASVAVGLASAQSGSDRDAKNGRTDQSHPAHAGEELPGRRTATSRTFRLPDGRLETRIYQAPVNYRDDDRWRLIDQSFRLTSTGAVVNGENAFDLRLPENLGSAPVRVAIGDHWIAQRPLGVDIQSIDAKGEEATYAGTNAADPTFSFASLATGLKENIELPGPSAPSTYRYALEASVGIQADLTSDGSIDFTDAEDDVVARMPPPLMYDSATPPRLSGAVRYDLKETEPQRWVLEVRG